MFGALIFLCIGVCVYGQSCNFDGFHACIKSGQPQGGDRKKFDEMKTNVDKCLKDSGCQTPPDKQQQVGSEQSRQCRKAIQQKIRNEVQQCVQAKFPDFKLPEQRNGEGHGDHDDNDAPPRFVRQSPDRIGSAGPGGFPGKHHDGDGGGRQRGGDNFEHTIDRFCKDAQAKTKARQCLEPLKKKEVGKRPDFKAIRQQMCQRKTECLQKLTPDCQKRLNDTKNEVCRCAKEKISPQSAQLETSLKNCQPTQNTQVGGGGGGGRGGGGEGGRGGGHKFKGGSNRGSTIDRLINRLCQRHDPCQQDQNRSFP